MRILIDFLAVVGGICIIGLVLFFILVIIEEHKSD